MKYLKLWENFKADLNTPTPTTNYRENIIEELKKVNNNIVLFDNNYIEGIGEIKEVTYGGEKWLTIYLYPITSTQLNSDDGVSGDEDFWNTPNMEINYDKLPPNLQSSLYDVIANNVSIKREMNEKEWEDLARERKLEEDEREIEVQGMGKWSKDNDRPWNNRQFRTKDGIDNR